MIEMMLDLETLDTKSSAVVLSVGAVLFEMDDDGYTIHDKFYHRLKIEDQIRRGRTVSDETLSWWIKQDSKAFNEAFGGERIYPGDTLCSLIDFISDTKTIGYNFMSVDRFWAKPATFDFPIWESLSDSYYAYDYPWDYKSKRDLHTAVDMAKYSVKDHPDPQIEGVPHNPIYDCLWQIDLLAAVRKKNNS